MYLFVFEDGSCLQMHDVRKSDYHAYDKGLCELVKFENGVFKQYVGNDEWAVVMDQDGNYFEEKPF